MRNKKLALTMFFTAALAVSGAPRLSAHCGHCGVGEDGKAMGNKEHVDQKLDNLSKKLGLTDQQKSAIRPALEEFWSKKETMMKDHMAQMDALHADKKAKIVAVLTPEQEAKWEKMQEDMPMKKGGDHKHGKKEGHHCDAECCEHKK